MTTTNNDGWAKDQMTMTIMTTIINVDDDDDDDDDANDDDDDDDDANDDDDDWVTRCGAMPSWQTAWRGLLQRRYAHTLIDAQTGSAHARAQMHARPSPVEHAHPCMHARTHTHPRMRALACTRVRIASGRSTV